MSIRQTNERLISVPINVAMTLVITRKRGSWDTWRDVRSNRRGNKNHESNRQKQN